MANIGAAGLLAISLLPAVVHAKDLSKYPCTVFSQEACFRLPADTSVTLASPVDFELYTVSKGALPIATIYIGNAPLAMEGATPSMDSRSRYGTIQVYRGAGSAASVMDIYINPSNASGMTVHISADVRPSTRNELDELLSSFRPCTSIRKGGQKCPLNDAWSRELTKALAATK